MGKRIDQLKLDDTPIVAPDPDLRAQPWYQFSLEIDDLLGTGQYTWAEPTLHDIQLTVERTKAVTEGQRKAVQNIEDGIYKSRGRRYEGFGWRQR